MSFRSYSLAYVDERMARRREWSCLRKTYLVIIINSQSMLRLIMIFMWSNPMERDRITRLSLSRNQPLLSIPNGISRKLYGSKLGSLSRLAHVGSLIFYPGSPDSSKPDGSCEEFLFLDSAVLPSKSSSYDDGKTSGGNCGISLHAAASRSVSPLWCPHAMG